MGCKYTIRPPPPTQKINIKNTLILKALETLGATGTPSRHLKYLIEIPKRCNYGGGLISGTGTSPSPTQN